jgi:excinuclease UvrABC helicase subunit UvrB
VVELEADMYKHAENLEFEAAARSRDKIEELRADYYGHTGNN